MENETPATQASHLNQPIKGAHVTGNVTTEGGDFVGRDQIIHGDEVHGPKIEKGGVAVEATGVLLTEVSAGGDIHIHDIHAGITYQNILPRPVDATTLQVANAKLAELPLNRIPPVVPLSTGSRLMFSVNPLFVGREVELMKLAAALKGGKTVAVGQTAAATGLGGIGKTQLAVAFVHHYGQFFAGGVYWLNFADPNAILTEIANCGFAMPDVRADFATLDLETKIRLVLAAWQNPLPRLLIFDNCEETALLAQWRPTTGGSRVLVTSRRSTWDAALGVSVVTLDTLPRAQSLKLLCKFPLLLNKLPFTAEDEPLLTAIASELGDLPLALHLAGNYLTHYRREVSPAKYLAQLRQPNLLQHRSLQAGDLSPTGHVQHVERTFALSYERLNPTEPMDALARDLLARATWFAPGQLIPRALLLASVELADEEQTLQAADALQQLANLGLVEMEAAGDLRMHRLVAHFVQQADLEAAQAAQMMVAAALSAEAHRLNNAGVPGPLLVWQSHLRHIIETFKNQSNEQTARLCNELGLHLSMLGSYAAAKPYYERALTIRQAVLGEERPDTAISYNNLGMGLLDLGELTAAQSCFERALKVQETVLGEEHYDTAVSYNNLGLVFQAKRDLIKAQFYLERALKIQEAILGEKHPLIATCYNNLGDLLYVMGRATPAKFYFDKATKIRETILGKDHPDTAVSYNNLGSLLLDLGELTSAKPYLENALIIRKAALGERHPYTAQTYNNLGRLLQAMGALSEAKSYLEQALKIYEESLEADHIEVRIVRRNLANLEQAMQQNT